MFVSCASLSVVRPEYDRVSWSASLTEDVRSLLPVGDFAFRAHFGICSNKCTALKHCASDWLIMQVQELHRADVPRPAICTPIFFVPLETPGSSLRADGDGPARDKSQGGHHLPPRHQKGLRWAYWQLRQGFLKLRLSWRNAKRQGNSTRPGGMTDNNKHHRFSYHPPPPF
jgi:hypothetical protein